ncbi:hypothetical protein HAZT_HAZT005087 [Hyalella azteca]|uniref:Muscleblind-like CCCH zinc finger domain-containing protein n=1 Tax=Hyalella azteca TaxID=294128 RepID=A0A6A0H8R1_HYAAZ|nr:hypothetical protein HAZT_HAZT005087 [Hyalella azteca]
MSPRRSEGRCNREKPPCKYFHPPQHLKDQLLINGRNHLALKNALMTQIHGLPPTTSVMPGTLQMIPDSDEISPGSREVRGHARLALTSISVQKLRYFEQSLRSIRGRGSHDIKVATPALST